MKKNDNKFFNNKTQTCRNCGINGHLYKDCIHPIMSFGIICYKIENNNIKFLMIQRKDSLAFMEFIRGKYNINNREYVNELIMNMTKNEKTLIKNNNFDEIWNYAWSQFNNQFIKQTLEYIESKKKYLQLIQNGYIINLINKTLDYNYEQEWGFPKGRRKLKENNLDCAIREFTEETRIIKEELNLLNEENFEEIFYGSNNILYKHVYYLAKIKNNNIKLEVDKNCIEQSREIRNLQWLSYEEVLKKIKKKNIERLNLFKLVYNIINENLNL